MSSWGVEVVLHALNKHGLSVLGPVFKEHNIRGVSLGRLTDERLEAFGISSWGQRDEVLLMVEKYQKRDAEVKSAARVSEAELKARQQLTEILAFIEPRSKRDEAVHTLMTHDCYDLFSLKLLSATDYEKMGTYDCFFEW